MLQGLCACGARRIRGLDAMAFDTPYTMGPPSAQPFADSSGPTSFAAAATDVDNTAAFGKCRAIKIQSRKAGEPEQRLPAFSDWTDFQRSARDQLFCACNPTQCRIQRRELWIFWARTHRRFASGNLHIWIYGYTTFHTDIFPSKKVWGISPVVHQCKVKGYVGRTLPHFRGYTMRPRLNPVCHMWKFVLV